MIFSFSDFIPSKSALFMADKNDRKYLKQSSGSFDRWKKIAMDDHVRRALLHWIVVGELLCICVI